MFEARLKNIRQKLAKEKLDGVLISSVSNISYLIGYTNFSREEREAYLVIGNNFQYIVTDARYSEAIKKTVPHFKLFERSHQNPTEQLFKVLKDQIKILGLEEDNLTVSEYKLVKKYFKNTKHFDISKTRSIKTSAEIKRIKTACQVGDLAFEFILKKIKVGITEKQVVLELENFIRSKGAQFSFPAIVAFGKNCAIPHHQTGDSVLEKRNGQFVLLDFGVKLDNYCSDMTRTVFFGNPTKKQQEIYQTVLAAQQKAVDFLNATFKKNKKVIALSVDEVARNYIESKGYPTIPHSLGHGIGLEVHEHPHISPKSKDTLKTGMVFSIEPGIYLPNFGGVRIEDLYVCQKDRLSKLTTSTTRLIVL